MVSPRFDPKQDSSCGFLIDCELNCVFHLLLCRLKECHITIQGCMFLACGLTFNTSHLKELDLSKNKILDGGVWQLSEIFNKCSLETLRYDCPTCRVSNQRQHGVPVKMFLCFIKVL